MEFSTVFRCLSSGTTLAVFRTEYLFKDMISLRTVVREVPNVYGLE